MITVLSALVSLLSFRLRGRASLELELIALRHQVTVLRRLRPGRPKLFCADRLLWVWLYRIWPQASKRGQQQLLHQLVTAAAWEGQKRSEQNTQYLYQGISARAFRRTFNLADHVKVKSACFEHGLLEIDLGARSARGYEAAAHSKSPLDRP